VDELESRHEIEAAAERLLRRADAFGRFPTPVDDIVAAASLSEPEESLLSPALIAKAPRHLADAMRRIGGRIWGLVDRRAREVHLDPEVTHEGRRRFIRLHETGHDALEWQKQLAYADNEHTLSPIVRKIYELEASSFAAEVLYQRGQIREDASSLQIGLASVVELSTRFGASLRSTLRRYAEQHPDVVAAVVLDAEAESTEPLTYQRREMATSSAFSVRFGSGYWPGRLLASRFDFLNLAAGASLAPNQFCGGTTRLADVNGSVVSVRCEALCTGYNVLVLLWLPRSERTRRKLKLAREVVGPRP
jgi:hypothetical protein